MHITAGEAIFFFHLSDHIELLIDNMAYSGSQPVSEVVLSISCRDLADEDFFSKSDPIVVVQESPDGVKWNEVREYTVDIVRNVRD